MQTFTQIYETHEKAVLTAYDLENEGIPSSDITVAGVPTAHEMKVLTNSRAAWIGNAGAGAAIGVLVGVLAELEVFTAASRADNVPSDWLAVLLVSATLGALVGIVAGLAFATPFGRMPRTIGAGKAANGTQVTVKTDKAPPLITAILKRHMSSEPLMARRT